MADINALVMQGTSGRDKIYALLRTAGFDPPLREFCRKHDFWMQDVSPVLGNQTRDTEVAESVRSKLAEDLAHLNVSRSDIDSLIDGE